MSSVFDTEAAASRFSAEYESVHVKRLWIAAFLCRGPLEDARAWLSEYAPPGEAEHSELFDVFERFDNGVCDALIAIEQHFHLD